MRVPETIHTACYPNSWIYACYDQSSRNCYRRSRSASADLRAAVLSGEAQRMVRASKRALFSACLLCGIGLGLGELTSRTLGGRLAPRAPEIRAQIVASLDGARPFESRFTGGFAAGPVTQLTPAAKERLERVVLGLQASLSPRENALVHAISGDLDRAVLLFEEESARAPDDAAVLSDLAAAYLTRAQVSRRTFDAVRALMAAQRALRLEPALVEARFARALALERLLLPAGKAWELCRNVETSPDWQRELRQRILKNEPRAGLQSNRDSATLLDAALAGDQDLLDRWVQDRPRAAQRKIEEEYLPLWASARETGSAAVAEAALEVSRRISDSLADVSGDSLFRDALKAIDETVGHEERRATLARGHSAYALGRALFQKGAYAAAAEELTTARRDLLSAGSPLHLRANLYLGYSQKYLSGNRSASERVAKTAEQVRSLDYPILAGESLRILGLLRLYSGEPHLAQEAYRSALVESQRAGDLENLARTHNLLAEILGYQGETEEAWRHWGEAARLARAQESPEVLYQVYSVAAMSALRLEEPEIAAAFQDEVVRSAERLGNSVALTSSLIWQARYRHRIGEGKAAGIALRQAIEAAARIPDAGAQAEVAIGLAIAEAEIEIQLFPERAMEHLARALDLAQKSGSLFHQIDAHLLRARAQLAHGQIEDAEEDLKRGIRLVSDWRRQTRAGVQKIGFQDRQRELFSEMIALQLDRRGDPVEALEYIEQWRAQALLDQIQDLDPRRINDPGRSLEDLPRLLPPRTVIVSYGLFGARLGIWISGTQGTNFRSVEIEPHQIRQAIRLARRGWMAPGASNPSTELLYEKLISPVRDLLPRGSNLVICANGDLGAIAWAALRDERSGRFLIENHVLTVAPSIRVYLNSLERDRDRARNAEPRLLAIGDPALASFRSPWLSPLPSARAEASGAGALFQGSLVLSGEQATRGRVLHEISGFDIVHFGAHAEVNRQEPGLSRIVLAVDPESDHGGFLTADEISGLRLNHLQLVVLATCVSARGRTSPSEGTQSLARAFLMAGAPAVLGSLWKVDDTDSAELISEFYRRLRVGENAASALRSAQLSALRKADPPRGPKMTWAAFQLVGGVDTDNL